MENMMNDAVTVIDGKIMTTSLKIAEVFAKDHDKVIRTIESLQVPDSFKNANFGELEIPYQNGLGKEVKRKAYQITRDGFTLLAMGFTGTKAMQFKLAYIDAFNRMEAELQSGMAVVTSGCNEAGLSVAELQRLVMQSNLPSSAKCSLWQWLDQNGAVGSGIPATSHQRLPMVASTPAAKLRPPKIKLPTTPGGLIITDAPLHEPLAPGERVISGAEYRTRKIRAREAEHRAELWPIVRRQAELRAGMRISLDFPLEIDDKKVIPLSSLGCYLGIFPETIKTSLNKIRKELERSGDLIRADVTPEIKEKAKNSGYVLKCAKGMLWVTAAGVRKIAGGRWCKKYVTDEK